MSQPRSIIRLYEVYDLTPDYLHTRFFDTEAIRDAYFLRKVGHITDADGHTVELTWYQTQHIRIDDGFVKLPYPLKEIHDFTYMSIKNSKGTNNSDDHAYYCFIKDMEYVSDMCTKVYFEVDVLQTYFNRISFYDCLINRAHSRYDTFPDNIKAEPFSPTEFIVNDESYASSLQDQCLIVAIASQDSYATINWVDGQGTPQSITLNLQPTVYFANTLTYVRYLAFSEALVGSAFMVAFLNYFSGEKAKEIVDMYTCPSVCVPSVSNLVEIDPSEASPITIDSGINFYGFDPTNKSLNGYVPKNNKMFCYPFNFLRATNGEGQTKDFAFEYFDITYTQSTPSFTAEGSFMNEPCITIYPQKYKRTATTMHDTTTNQNYNQDINYDDSISLNGYPHGAWTIDYYTMYQQQNKTANSLKVVGTTIAGASMGLAMTGIGVGIGLGGLAFSGIMMGASSIISGVKQSVDTCADEIRAKKTADIMLGSTTGSDVPQAHNHKNFYFYRMTVDNQYAKMVDDFFTMYGYAMNEIKNLKTHLTQVRTTRRHYCFIKCTNILIQGGIENKYKEKIAKILTDGITFWFKNSAQDEDVMGNYSVDNSVVVG